MNSHKLELCNLEVLELHRLRADLIMMYKILNGVICVNLVTIYLYLLSILPEKILSNCIIIVRN